MNGLDEFLGKHVVISKTDGFRKHGVLVSYDDRFVKLRWSIGTEEIIPLVNIGGIALEGE